MNPRRMALRHLVGAHLRGRTYRPSRPAPAPVWTAPAGAYVICTTPRSGSWLLCDGLTATGVAGRPREWFNVIEEQEHCARWRLTHDDDLGFRRYLRMARAESLTANGVSGIKLHYYQFASFPARFGAFPSLAGAPASDVATRLFPDARYIWLTRHDKVRQAISFLRASRSDVWWSLDGGQDQGPAAQADPPDYDAAAIARMEQVFAGADLKWRAFFDGHGIEPHVVNYEALADDYAGVMASVLRFIGPPGGEGVTPGPPRLQRQSDALSADWAGRYRAEGGAFGQASAFRADRGDAQTLRMRRLFQSVPPTWRQWIAQCARSGTPQAQVAAVLARHGYAPEAIEEAIGSTRWAAPANGAGSR